MGLKLSGSSTSGTPPPFEEGMQDAIFKGVRADVIEKSQYDPEVFIWVFHVKDADGKVLYDEGEPIEFEKVTSRSTNTKSKTTPGAVKVLKALMTKEEFVRFENEDEIDADDLLDRPCQVVIFKKDSGWPGIDDVLMPRKGQK